MTDYISIAKDCFIDIYKSYTSEKARVKFLLMMADQFNDMTENIAPSLTPFEAHVRYDLIASYMTPSIEDMTRLLEIDSTHDMTLQILCHAEDLNEQIVTTLIKDNAGFLQYTALSYKVRKFLMTHDEFANKLYKKSYFHKFVRNNYNSIQLIFGENIPDSLQRVMVNKISEVSLDACISQQFQLDHVYQMQIYERDLKQEHLLVDSLRELRLLSSRVMNPIIETDVLAELRTVFSQSRNDFKPTVLKFLTNGKIPVEIAKMFVKDIDGEFTLASI